MKRKKGMGRSTKSVFGLRRMTGIVAALAFVLSTAAFLPAVEVKAAHETSENRSNHWETYGGKAYWYEHGVKQGTYDDPDGVVGDGTVRGREIYDPASDGWYWLDSVYDGAKACGKEVWMPYIYQDEKDWSDEQIWSTASACGDMADQVEKAIREGIGKWVRYDANGKMYKGWYEVKGAGNELYPSQAGNIYYYDGVTGLMAKGAITIDGERYVFDETTGALLEGEAPDTVWDESLPNTGSAGENENDGTGDTGESGNGGTGDAGESGNGGTGDTGDGTGEDVSQETVEEALAAIARAEIGDIVTFGSYEQDDVDEDGAERIKWYVLDKEDGQATLLSVYIIEAGRYHSSSDSVTWQTCGLRSWLNNEFYKEAFTAEERDAIASTTLETYSNPAYDALDTYGGGEVSDKVWLLSLEDVSKYFNIPMSTDVITEYNLSNPNNYSKLSYEYAIYCYNKDNRLLAKPTKYAYTRHNAEIWTEEDTEYYKKEYDLDFSYAEGAGWWWLRSPGRYNYRAACVNYNAEVYYYGVLTSFGGSGDGASGGQAYGAWRGGIRPAVNVKYE